MNGAHGKTGSAAKTVFVHLEFGHVVQEVRHADFATEWTVSWMLSPNAWRGERLMVRTFSTKREAWAFLGEVTSDPCNGVRVAA